MLLGRVRVHRALHCEGCARHFQSDAVGKLQYDLRGRSGWLVDGMVWLAECISIVKSKNASIQRIQDLKVIVYVNKCTGRVDVNMRRARLDPTTRSRRSASYREYITEQVASLDASTLFRNSG